MVTTSALFTNWRMRKTSSSCTVELGHTTDIRLVAFVSLPDQGTNDMYFLLPDPSLQPPMTGQVVQDYCDFRQSLIFLDKVWNSSDSGEVGRVRSRSKDLQKFHKIIQYMVLMELLYFSRQAGWEDKALRCSVNTERNKLYVAVVLLQIVMLIEVLIQYQALVLTFTFGYFQSKLRSL